MGDLGEDGTAEHWYWYHYQIKPTWIYAFCVCWSLKAHSVSKASFWQRVGLNDVCIADLIARQEGTQASLRIDLSLSICKAWAHNNAECWMAIDDFEPHASIKGFPYKTLWNRMLKDTKSMIKLRKGRFVVDGGIAKSSMDVGSKICRWKEQVYYLKALNIRV